MLVKYGLWGFMKSNLTKSVVVLAGFALLYVLTRIPLVHVGERVVSCRVTVPWPLSCSRKVLSHIL